MSSSYHNHLIPPQAMELDLADSLGLSISMFRFAVSILASVPIAYFFRFLSNASPRHWYAFITGFLLIYYPFGNGCLHSLLLCGVTYALMARFRQRCGKLAWLIVMPYMIATHIAQASGMSWKDGQLDFTGAQMILTLKLIAIAMCYQDGVQKTTRLRKYAVAKSLPVLPSMLEFLSYAFFCGNLLSGPFFEAKDYFDFIKLSGSYAELKKTPEGRRPSPLVPGLVRFLKAIVCVALWMGLTSGGLGVEILETDLWRTQTPPLKRAFLAWAVIAIYRFKYYFVWTMAESGLILSGFGYERNGRWDRFVNARILGVELNASLSDLPRHWNICTGNWLRHYVYERLVPPDKRPSFLNMMLTQLVSGVWHGVFAGYWLFFGTSAFMFQAGRILYRYEENWSPKVQNSWPWTIVKIIITEFVLNYCATSFVVLSARDSFIVWQALYYSGHIFIALVLLVGFVMPPKRRKLKEIEVEGTENLIKSE